MAALFRRIVESDESGKKIVENYQKAHPESFARLLKIAFDHPHLSLYRLWGVVALVLGLSEEGSLEEAAATLEREAILFDGVRGPRIDYRIYSDEGNVQFDPLMTIRTAMSFYLAGVDPDEISYGVVESFCEFLGTELDQVEQSMGTEGITLSGSLLTNGRLFAKITEELSLNHTIYLNNQLPVHGRNVLYGGTDPLTTEVNTASDT
jgi:hydrogenase maturation factor HypF (carbamoyltransferase family)